MNADKLIRMGLWVDSHLMTKVEERPATATAVFIAQVAETAMVFLFWFFWSFGFGKMPFSLVLSSAIFGLPLVLSAIAARGLKLGREWAWWLSFFINGTFALCVLALASFDMRAVLRALPFLALIALLLLPTNRRYYFTFRPDSSTR